MLHICFCTELTFQACKLADHPPDLSQKMLHTTEAQVKKA